MRVGIIGTGAIAQMHARAYKNIGWTVRACTNVTQKTGRTFADLHGAEFVERYEDVCRHPEVDLVDVCTFPGFRLEAVDGGTELSQRAQLGPARSGLSRAIDEMPDKEQKIVFVRLREFEAGMTSNLEHIKRLAES